MEPADSWLCDPDQIEQKLREIASSFVPNATGLIVANEIRRQAGNIDLMPKGSVQKSLPELTELIQERTTKESLRLNSILDAATINGLTESIYDQLQASLASGTDEWKCQVPGKQILSKFSSLAHMPEGRLKTLYIQESENADANPFEEIIEIFSDFSNCS